MRVDSDPQKRVKTAEKLNHDTDWLRSAGIVTAVANTRKTTATVTRTRR
jgi:hypothetical protein